MAAHAVTGLTQAIHMSYGDGEKFWRQMDAALNLDCWTAELTAEQWGGLYKLSDGFKLSPRPYYNEIARDILIKALPLMVIKWQMLGEPRTREEWRKASHNAYNQVNDKYLDWEMNTERTINFLTKPLPYPVTGVISQHSVESWIFEEETIDLDWEEHLATCDNEDHDDCYESNEPTLLLGAWKKDPESKTHQYVADFDGDGDFAAIYSGNTGNVQVVWSTYTTMCNKCSPCYPGQGDLDTPGDDYLAYDIPPEMRWEEDSDGK